MTLVRTTTQIGRTLRNAHRMRSIVSVFAKHGFYNIAERVKLGRFLIERITPADDIEKYTLAERVRMSFEELGPTFVKLGQVLATRPDLVPEDFVIEFSKLHDHVQPLSFETVMDVLKQEFGASFDQHFASVDPNPLGSASIAQVHRAKLTSGEDVVVKVQRPGIVSLINEDLRVLYQLAELLETYVEETRVFRPAAIVDEFFKTLELETNFIVEANNIRRFQKNFQNDPHIRIPKVWNELTTERVLTMEAMTGVPLSSDQAFNVPGLNREEIMKRGLRAYLKMVFQDGLFHGDLHAGNFFILPNNEIGLIDFGVVGRLSHKVQQSIASQLIALAREDYERVAYEYIDLSPYSEHVNVDLFAKDLRDLVAPYFGLTLSKMDMGQLLMKSAGLASRHHLQVPAELMLYFKSLVNLEGLGRRLMPEFDFLSYATEFATELVKVQYDPTQILQELMNVGRESKSLISQIPRQMNLLFRRINSPDSAIKIQIKEMDQLRKAILLSFNLLFLGLVIGALIVSAAALYIYETGRSTGWPHMTIICILIASFLGTVAFWNYIRK